MNLLLDSRSTRALSGQGRRLRLDSEPLAAGQHSPYDPHLGSGQRQHHDTPVLALSRHRSHFTRASVHLASASRPERGAIDEQHPLAALADACGPRRRSSSTPASVPAEPLGRAPSRRLSRCPLAAPSPFFPPCSAPPQSLPGPALLRHHRQFAVDCLGLLPQLSPLASISAGTAHISSDKANDIGREG